MRPVARLACVGLAVLSLSLAGCTHNNNTPAPTTTPLPAVSVPLSLSGPVADQTIKIGIVVAPLQGEGSEYRSLADGARVAAYRFQMTGAKIEIDTALDDGTVGGMTSALSKLSGENDIGIIVASAGAHVRQALAQTHIQQPILLPYDSPDSPLQGVWSTGPTVDGINQAITQALGSAHVAHPFLVNDANQPDLTIPATTTAAYSSTMADQVVAALTSGAADSVVINAPAGDQAQLVTAVQQGLGNRQAPLILTPQALTPAFAQALAQTGMPSSPLITVGPNTNDPAALQPTSAGAHLAAFFSALRLAANDPTCMNIFGDAAFSQSAQSADAASHDATIALIRAAEKAGTTSPPAVAQALQTLTVQPDDGLAGPALDFRTATALSTSAIQPLYASSQNLGLRPTSDSTQPALVWFAQ